MTNAHYMQYSDHIRMGRCTARGGRGCTGGPRAAAGGAHCTERHTLPWLQRYNNRTSAQSARIVQGCSILRADHRQAQSTSAMPTRMFMLCLLGAVSRRASSKIAFCFSSRLHSFCTGGRRKVAHDGHMAMNGIAITALCTFGIVKLT